MSTRFATRLRTLERRVSALTDVRGLPEGFDLEEEAERWERTLQTAVDLMRAAPGECTATAEGLANDALFEFGWIHLAADPETEEPTRSFWRKRVPEKQRVPGAMRTLFRAAPADLLHRLGRSATSAKARSYETPFELPPWCEDWLDALSRLQTRIPPDLSPDLMRRLVTARVEHEGLWEGSLVCAACGLQRPCWNFTSETPGRPPLFKRCWCGQGDGQHDPWQHHIYHGQFDWQRRAAGELLAAAP